MAMGRDSFRRDSFKRRQWLQTFLSLLVFVGLSAAVELDRGTRSAAKSIDTATVAVYQQLGGYFYEGADHYTLVDWDHIRERGERGVPGFQLYRFPMEKLPAVAVPFALDLNGPNVTDAGLKELARFQNLDRLDLRRTQVTGVGLKELVGLTKLDHLNLPGQVTDAGLKELACLKNLTMLGFGGQHVTNVG
jgi:hypothetical protein